MPVAGGSWDVVNLRLTGSGCFLETPVYFFFGYDLFSYSGLHTYIYIYVCTLSTKERHRNLLVGIHALLFRLALHSCQVAEKLKQALVVPVVAMQDMFFIWVAHFNPQ